MSLVLVLMCSSSVEVSAEQGWGPRGSFDWRDYASISESLWSGDVMIKLEDGTEMNIEPARVEWVARGDVVDLFGVIPGAAVHGVERAFGMDLDALNAIQASGENRCACTLADLTTYVRVSLRPDMVNLSSLLARINALPGVEVAYPVADRLRIPLPVDIYPETPTLESEEGFLDAAPSGINARQAWEFPGGRGQHATVVDLEINWDVSHEDLERCVDGLITGLGTPYWEDIDFTHHGTAVLGQLFGGDNGYGVTGIVPEGTCGYAPDWSYEAGDIRASSLLAVAERYEPSGVVVLMESQTLGPRSVDDGVSQYGLLPSEWDPAVYDSIRTLVANGYTVVEAAGNGEQNLDDEIYAGRFDRSLYDSGAIIVGAGRAPRDPSPRSPAWFTNYGRRIDLQGWGEAVVTTGYGDAFDGLGDLHQFYTRDFGGTSSASPIVAGAIALVASVYIENYETAPSPSWLRDVLVETGTPQQNPEQHIGPLPNLTEALGTFYQQCGDSLVSGDEVCDDGNLASNDGCSADCLSNESCGNTIVDTMIGEACDDGNLVSGDGCAADCRSDESCGNGIVDTTVGEVCDDGNLASGDGCSADCHLVESTPEEEPDPEVGVVCYEGGGNCPEGSHEEAVEEEEDPTVVPSAESDSLSPISAMSGAMCSTTGRPGGGGEIFMVFSLSFGLLLIRVLRRRI